MRHVIAVRHPSVSRIRCECFPTSSCWRPSIFTDPIELQWARSPLTRVSGSHDWGANAVHKPRHSRSPPTPCRSGATTDSLPISKSDFVRSGRRSSADDGVTRTILGRPIAASTDARSVESERHGADGLSQPIVLPPTQGRWRADLCNSFVSAMPERARLPLLVQNMQHPIPIKPTSKPNGRLVVASQACGLHPSTRLALCPTA